MAYAMPVLRVEEAWRLSVDTSARVTLTLRVTPSGEEGVGASASSVSRLCPAHAMRICVQPCGSVHHCPRAQCFCWSEAQALASDAWHRSLLVCSLCRLQPGAVAYLGGSTRVAHDNLGAAQALATMQCIRWLLVSSCRHRLPDAVAYEGGSFWTEDFML